MGILGTVITGRRRNPVGSQTGKTDIGLQAEPSLGEILRDSVIQKRMAVDGVRTRDVLKLIASYRRWRRNSAPSLRHGHRPSQKLSEEERKKPWEIDCWVGHAALSAEHRELVDLYYEGPQECSDDDSGEALLRHYRKLLDRISNHFATAEQVMRETDFAGLEKHLLDQRVLRIEAEVIERRLKRNPADAATRALAWRMLWILVIGYAVYNDCCLRDHLSAR